MKLIVMTAYASILIVMSLAAVFLYGRDKSIAKHGGEKRIKEKTLLFVAVYGGAVGAFLGREIFRHKTTKEYFSFVIVTSMFLQAIALLMLVLDYGGVI